MSAGYVYILINQSMPGLIKIGRTLRDSKSRARELYTTGVPTPFEVAFEVFSESHEKLEADLHYAVYAFRVNDNREFFRYPLFEAIKLLQKLNSPPESSDSIYVAESIFHRLHNKYSNWLVPSIVDVRIVQVKNRVWLEITEEEEIGGYLIDQTIKRTDLGFTGVDGEDFSPLDPVTENANKFVERYDPYSIIMTTDLFHDDACREIEKNLNPHRSDCEK